MARCDSIGAVAVTVAFVCDHVSYITPLRLASDSLNLIQSLLEDFPPRCSVLDGWAGTGHSGRLFFEVRNAGNDLLRGR